MCVHYTGVTRLAQKLAERQKKRAHDEEMLELRLQRLRQQRNMMAARHKQRERSRSMEREHLDLTSDAVVGWVSVTGGDCKKWQGRWSISVWVVPPLTCRTGLTVE